MSRLSGASLALIVQFTPSHGQDAMQVAGSGRAVVLESGLGEKQSNWREVVPALARCLTVVTYDRPGIGAMPARPRPDAPVLAASVAEDLLSRLRAHNVAAPYILVGHSLGGLYVQAFARNYPDATAGLVLIDAASPLEPPGVFVSTVPPKPGSVEAAEEAGVAASVEALQAGPPLPHVPLIVLSATSHGDTPEREALWRDVQQRTAALSNKGQFTSVESGHFIQSDKPQAVIDAVLTVAAATGAEVSACRR